MSIDPSSIPNFGGQPEPQPQGPAGPVVPDQDLVKQLLDQMELKYVVDQLYLARLGKVDAERSPFWRSIFMYDSWSGCEAHISGWVNVFFPYVGSSGRTVNPCLDWRKVGEANASRGIGVPISYFPSNLASAPVKWTFPEDRKEYDMTFVAGFVGASQNPKTKALRPELAWAVLEKKPSEGNYWRYPQRSSLDSW